MDAAAVLERLSALGVTITPQPSGNLWLEPASKIPSDLVEMVREHKLEILAALEAKVSLPAGALGLLERLRKGAAFLMYAHNTLLETREHYSRLEPRFLAGIELFDSLDYMVRFLYGYQGCVLGRGQRCPDHAPVRCRACAAQCRAKAGNGR